MGRRTLSEPDNARRPSRGASCLLSFAAPPTNDRQTSIVLFESRRPVGSRGYYYCSVRAFAQWRPLFSNFRLTAVAATGNECLSDRQASGEFMQSTLEYVDFNAPDRQSSSMASEEQPGLTVYHVSTGTIISLAGAV